MLSSVSSRARDRRRCRDRRRSSARGSAGCRTARRSRSGGRSRAPARGSVTAARAPRALAAGDAVQQRLHDDVVHQREAGVAEREQLGGRHAQRVGEDRAELRQAEWRRRSCGGRCPPRRGSGRPGRCSRSFDRSSCSADGLPRVRSSFRPARLQLVVRARERGVRVAQSSRCRGRSAGRGRSGSGGHDIDRSRAPLWRGHGSTRDVCEHPTCDVVN